MSNHLFKFYYYDEIQPYMGVFHDNKLSNMLI
jgi:hypothetical protein